VGDGISDARCERWRALAILVVGCTIATTAADARDPLYAGAPRRSGSCR
jgi:hypothetical protein